MKIVKTWLIICITYSCGVLAVRIVEWLSGGIKMSIDFMNLPTEVIVGGMGMVILGVAGYIWKERKERKKTNKIDKTTDETKTFAVTIDGKLDKQADTLDKQSDKLDDINKYVAESRALKQAASGGGVDLNQTIASIQSMALQIIDLKDSLGRVDRNETSLKQELFKAREETENMRKEKQKLLQENKVLRSEINKHRSPHRKERENEER